MADTKPVPDDDDAGDPVTEEIVAYLDGELDSKTAEGIAARIRTDPSARAAADALQRTWDILDILPRPQPSATFATRTMSQAIPLPCGSASGPTIPMQYVGAGSFPVPVTPRFSAGFWFTSAAIVLLALGLGYFAHRELSPSKHLDPSLEDVPLMKNLRLYRNIDDIEFLKRLDSPEMFADEPNSTPATDSSLDQDDPGYLRRQAVWFQAQEPRRQQQIRKLHADFMQLDLETRAHLTRVMQSYNVWLAKLAPADHDRVVAAPNSVARFDVVRSMREASWVETLPKPYREEYAKLDEEGRRSKALEWRVEETERREQWALAQKHWSEHQGRVPPLFQVSARMPLETFVGHLRDNLSEVEIKELEEVRADAFEREEYYGYGLLIFTLAERHPLLPGKVGPKNFESLPDSAKSYLASADPQHFKGKGIGNAGLEIKELRRSQGRWPDFAVELTRYCQKHNLKLPVQLGDCYKKDMPPEVIEFLGKLDKLDTQLRRSKGLDADLVALNKAQGAWPEYPKMLMDLSKKYNTPIPGWTLPGPPQAWERFRTGKLKPK